MSTESSPHILAELARQAYEIGDYQEAVNAFAGAVASYTASGDSLMAAEMKNNQGVALIQAKKPQEALQVIQGTEIVFAEAGDLRRQGMAVGNQASALQALHRKEDAIALYEKAVSILEQAGESELRANVLQALAGLQIGRGKLTDAVIAMQSGLIGVEKPTLKQRILKKLLFLRLWR